MNKTTTYTGIKLAEVRIRNFRSLEKIDTTLDWLTVLVGENNAGKTNFLDALDIGIGANSHHLSEEDIYLSSTDVSPPRNREIIIDVLIRPTDENGNLIHKFPRGNDWIGFWGSGLSLDETDSDCVGIRTRLFWNQKYGVYDVERKFLKRWEKQSINIEKIETSKQAVTLRQINALNFYLMSPNRDVLYDMKGSNSIWNRMTSELGIDPKKIQEIEEKLKDLNKGVISESRALNHIKAGLEGLKNSLKIDEGNISIRPVPNKIQDLNKGIDITFANRDSQEFPLYRHSSGTRSIASVILYSTYVTWVQSNSQVKTTHSILAVEEPETHLHPHVERVFFAQLKEMATQVIVSSHSPLIIAQTPLKYLRHFKREGATTKVSQIELDLGDEKSLIKLDRKVMQSHGEIVFAKALILYEGEETEDQVLPIFAEEYWNANPDSFGISMISVKGIGYCPFINLARSLDIPWYIFSDGENIAVQHLKNQLARFDVEVSSPNIFIIPDGHNFERYVVTEEYKDVLIAVIISVKAQNQNHEEALRQEWHKKQDPLNEILQEISKDRNKIIYATPIATAFTELDDENLKFPRLIRKLFEKVSDDLGIPRRGGA